MERLEVGQEIDMLNCPNCTKPMTHGRCTDLRNCGYGHLAVDCSCKQHAKA